MVELPFGIVASANVFGRQGFPTLYFVELWTYDPFDSTYQIQIGSPDTLPNAERL